MAVEYSTACLDQGSRQLPDESGSRDPRCDQQRTRGQKISRLPNLCLVFLGYFWLFAARQALWWYMLLLQIRESLILKCLTWKYSIGFKIHSLVTGNVNIPFFNETRRKVEFSFVTISNVVTFWMVVKLVLKLVSPSDTKSVMVWLSTLWRTYHLRVLRNCYKSLQFYSYKTCLKIHIPFWYKASDGDIQIMSMEANSSFSLKVLEDFLWKFHTNSTVTFI